MNTHQLLDFQQLILGNLFLEVVEDAGLLVNPLDHKEIVNAMCEISSNTKLRNQYIQKGIKQAEKFSWEKTAKKTLEAYQNIIAQNPNEKSQ